jgi:hypothetical protein
LNEGIAAGELQEISLVKSGGMFKLAGDPFAGKVTWQIRPASPN